MQNHLRAPLRAIALATASAVFAPICRGQTPCIPDADGDGHPLFGMLVQRAGPEFDDNGEFIALYAVDVAFGDLDSDGDRDMAVAVRDRAEPESWVGILLNRGDGVFDRAPLCDAGMGENAAALGDMNADGVLDVVVAAALSDEVGVLLGRGDGTFGDALLFPAGDQPRSVVVAEFDGDGILDAATLNTGSSDVSLFRGLGDGSLGDERREGVGGVVSQPGLAGKDPGPFLAAGDVNGDGFCDVAVPAVVSVRFLINTGDGAFALSEEEMRAPSDMITDIELADLNRDGLLDVATSIRTGLVLAAVGLNAGGGRFPHVDVYDGSFWGSAAYMCTTVSLGDMDGDGAADLVLPNRVDGTCRCSGAGQTAHSGMQRRCYSPTGHGPRHWKT